MRGALLTNILTPYRIPVYRALERDTLHWRVFTNADTEFDRGWRTDRTGLDVERVCSWAFRRSFAFGGPGVAQQVTTHVPIGLLGALRRHRPDVVVSAELGPRTLAAWLYCRIASVPLVIWSYHSRASATAGPAQQRLRRLLLARADAVVGMGTQAREVLTSYGVDPKRVFDAPNACDTAGLAKSLAVADPAALHRDLAASARCRERIALVAGRLVAGKGIEPLLDAWSDLPPRLRARWTLLFLGDGPLGPAVERAARAGEPGEIARVPAVAPNCMAAYYAASELLVFPSLGDPWGLVVNEAFGCGVPVVCSSRAGCADDLVRPGENGWIADPTHLGEWTAALRAALEHPDLASLGARARAAVRRFSPEAMAAGILAATQYALAAHGRRALQPSRAGPYSS